MHPPRCGVDLLLQAVGVRRSQLCQLSPVENLSRDLYALSGQIFKHRDIGRILPRFAFLAALEPHFVEQDIAELLRAADGKRLTRKRINFYFQLATRLRKLARQPRQHRAVDLDSGAFHFRQNRNQRPVDHFVNARRLFRAHPQLEMMPKPERHVRILGRITGGVGQLYCCKTDLRFAGTGYRFVRDALVAKMQFCQLVHPVPVIARVERKAHDHGIIIWRDRNAVPRQHRHIVFQVLTDFQHRWIGQQGPQFRQRFSCVQLCWFLGKHIGATVRERDIACLTRSDCKTEPDQIGACRLQAVGFGIEAQ